MVAKFIRLMSDGKMYSQHELSRELNLSLETVQAFIEYLSIKRMLITAEQQPEESSSCSNGCSRYAGCKGCIKKQSSGHTLTLWEFRKKLHQD